MPPLLHRQAEAGRLRWAGGALRAPLREAEGQEVAADDRRAALLAAKLRALVHDHFDVAGADRPSTFPGGATLRLGDRGWVLAEDRPARALGQALAWAHQHDVDDLHLLVEEHGGLLARRAAQFARPPAVWLVDGRALEPAAPEPLPPPPQLDPRAEELVRVIVAAGAEPVVEHGVLFGEVAGLEVVRAVTDGDGVHLEVGVGRHDREAFQLVHGDRPTADALGSVIRTVRRHRRPGAPSHPLNRLGSERWLRHLVLSEPGLVGAATLSPAPPPLPRDNVKDAVPAIATGVDPEGRSMVVACSVGIDLDLVPTGADARLALDLPAARLVLAVPERDDHPTTRALAAALAEPAEVAVLPADWRDRANR